jgi:hypothetical protein
MSRTDQRDDDDRLDVAPPPLDLLQLVDVRERPLKLSVCLTLMFQYSAVFFLWLSVSRMVLFRLYGHTCHRHHPPRRRARAD